MYGEKLMIDRAQTHLCQMEVNWRYVDYFRSMILVQEE